LDHPLAEFARLNHIGRAISNKEIARHAVNRHHQTTEEDEALRLHAVTINRYLDRMTVEQVKEVSAMVIEFAQARGLTGDDRRD
jgi:hypothetical protein